MPIPSAREVTRVTASEYAHREFMKPGVKAMAALDHWLQAEREITYASDEHCWAEGAEGASLAAIAHRDLVCRCRIEVALQGINLSIACRPV